MCHPAIVIGIGAAVIGAAANVSQAESDVAYQNAVAQQKYEVAKAEAERSNMIAEQEYENQLRIIDQNDQVKAKDFANKTQAWEAALNANQRQTEVNTIANNLANAQVDIKKKTANAKASFDLEKSLVTMIQAQGEMLATGGSGQSFLLQTTQADKAFGMSSQRIEEILAAEQAGFDIEFADIAMDYFTAETVAYNNLPSAPQSEYASMLPYEPILDPGPAEPIERKVNYTAAILGGVAGGVQAGASAYGGG